MNPKSSSAATSVSASAASTNWTPAWAREAIWYQIFPDRFRNGDPSNNPSLDDIKGAWPHDNESPWQVHPWGSDWYEMQPYEKANGKDIWFQIQRRRYGGDLQGILDKLDYLQDLGVNALYLNPVFQAPSLHKYDASTYHHVDPTFGPEPSGDKKIMAAEDPADPSTWQWTAADKMLLKLIKQCHQRGMRIILDGVFNHVGMNHWAFQDVKEKQQASPYKDWFVIKSWEDPGAGTKFDYEGWFGVRELPEWLEDEDGIVAGPRKYIFDITRRWMDPDGDGDPQDGIDGWRLDVAFCVRHEFWKAWRKQVKAINPEAYLTAEVIDSNEKLKSYLEGDEFDAVMNYNFAFTCSEFFIHTNNVISVTEFAEKLKALREAFDSCVTAVQQNLFGSHDTHRVASHMVNAEIGNYRDWGEFFEQSKATNPKYNARKPNAQELKRLKLMVLFQMTYIGAPMIYYGDEVGMWGGNDPCCRKPMVWDDLTYSPEAINPTGVPRGAPDTVEQERALFDHYRTLVKLRRSSPALLRGDFNVVKIDDAASVFGFRRSLGNEEAVVVFMNSGLNPVAFDWDAEGAGPWQTVFGGQGSQAGEDGVWPIELEPESGVVLQFKR